MWLDTRPHPTSQACRCVPWCVHRPRRSRCSRSRGSTPAARRRLVLGRCRRPSPCTQRWGRTHRPPCQGNRCRGMHTRRPHMDLRREVQAVSSWWPWENIANVVWCEHSEEGADSVTFSAHWQQGLVRCRSNAAHSRVNRATPAHCIHPSALHTSYYHMKTFSNPFVLKIRIDET